MTLYTKHDCPLCNVVKLKLNVSEIPYDICTDEKKMEELNIDALPVLILDSGEKLEFKQIIDFIKEKEEKSNEN